MILTAMPNDYFRFKEFTVYQERCAMKVGTDGVLLGAWTNIAGAGSILDVGTGTGLLALMAAQKSGAQIDAVELEKSAAMQAQENVEASAWRDRIKVEHISFQEFAATCHTCYDVILSNPPFFDQSLRSPGLARSMARHNDSLTLDELFLLCDRLLSPAGRLNVIIPWGASESANAKAFFAGLHPCRITIVYPKPGKMPVRQLIEFCRDHSVQPHTENLTIRNESGSYTEQYRKLTKDFYL